MRAAYVVSGDTALCADREAQTVASLFAVLDGTMLGLVSSHDDSALLYCIPAVIVDGVIYPPAFLYELQHNVAHGME